MFLRSWVGSRIELAFSMSPRQRQAVHDGRPPEWRPSMKRGHLSILTDEGSTGIQIKSLADGSRSCRFVMTWRPETVPGDVELKVFRQPKMILVTVSDGCTMVFTCPQPG